MHMSIRMVLKPLPLLTLLLGAASVLSAQATTGTLSGTVKEGLGKPLAGATVTLHSAALMHPRVVVTNDRGEWHAPLLPPGSYRVIVSLGGFISASAADIRIGLGATLRQDFTLKRVKAAEAVVEVTADPGDRMERAETKVSTNYSSSDMDMLAMPTRSFQSAALLTPEILSNVTGNGEISIAGSTTNATLYRVNGVDIKNDVQGTVTGTQVIEDMIEDLQVVVSGLHARLGGTTGGTINAVLKQGSNTFSGSIRAKLARPSWTATRIGDRPVDLAQGYSDGFNKIFDVTFLGPILRDRLWFSFASQEIPSQVSNATVAIYSPISSYNRPYVTGNALVDAVTLAGPGAPFISDLFDAGKPYLRKTDKSFYQGTLTYAVNPNHTLASTFTFLDQAWNPYDASGVNSSFQTLGRQSSKTRIYGLEYRGLLAPRVFMEARYNVKRAEVQFPSGVNPSFPEPIFHVPDNVNTAARFPISNKILSGHRELIANASGEVNVKVFWEGRGNHDSDLGYQRYDSIKGTADQFGPANRAFFSGALYHTPGRDDFRFGTIAFQGLGRLNSSADGRYSLTPLMRQYLGQDGEMSYQNQALYLNDDWTLSSTLSVMTGLRYDWIKGINTDGTTINQSSSLSPRLLLKWDPTGEAKHVFQASYALYRDNMTVALGQAFARSATNSFVDLAWTGVGIGQPQTVGMPGDKVNGREMYGVRFVDYSQFTSMANYRKADGTPNALAYSNGRDGWVVDPNLKSPYTHEFRLGYQRAFKGGSSVRVNTTYKRWGNLVAFRSDWTPDHWLQVANPLAPASKVYVQKTYVANSNQLRREFKALTLAVNQRISNHWSLNASSTYSRLTGNDEAGDSPSSTFRENGVTATPMFNNAFWYGRMGLDPDTVSPAGFLVNHQLLRMIASVNGHYPIGKGGHLSPSWVLNYDTGRRISLRTVNQLATDRTLFGIDATNKLEGVPVPTQPTTFTRGWGDRGLLGYNDTYSVDFKVAFSAPLGIGRMKLIGDIFVNNLFNNMLQSMWLNTSFNVGTRRDVMAPYLPASFGSVPWGTSTASAYFLPQRTVATSIGLKF